uniref:Uncharacterized protein n=1 Tax=Geobacillus sp. (strain Y4.1MC1) TaxID=581103 RepID=A0A7U3YCU6_GEOS0
MGDAQNIFNHFKLEGKVCLLQNKNTEFCKENVQSLIG